MLTRPNKQNKQQGSSSASYQRFLQTATALPILSRPKSLLSQARYSRLLPVRLPGANIQQEQPDGLDSVKSSNLTLEGAFRSSKAYIETAPLLSGLSPKVTAGVASQQCNIQKCDWGKPRGERQQQQNAVPRQRNHSLSLSHSLIRPL